MRVTNILLFYLYVCKISTIEYTKYYVSSFFLHRTVEVYLWVIMYKIVCFKAVVMLSEHVHGAQVFLANPVQNWKSKVGGKKKWFSILYWKQKLFLMVHIERLVAFTTMVLGVLEVSPLRQRFPSGTEISLWDRDKGFFFETEIYHYSRDFYLWQRFRFVTEIFICDGDFLLR